MNILIFDKNFVFLDVAYAQVTTDGVYHLLSTNYTVKEPGYAFVFVSHEDSHYGNVWFDDVSVSYTPSNVLQYSEYFPYGLKNEKSWTRTGTVDQNFLFNGKEQINDLNLDWYDYDARMYMPETGRWGVVDPLAELSEFWTPYSYAFDNPVVYTDPSGMDPRWDSNGGGYYEDANNNHTREADEETVPYATVSQFYNLGGSSDMYVRNPNIDGDQWMRLDAPETFIFLQNSVGRRKLEFGKRSDSQQASQGSGGDEGDSHWLEHIIGPIMIQLGQPDIAKRFVTPGSSPGTSVASKVLSKILPIKSPVRLPTLIVNSSAVRIAWTKSLGKFAGRLVPFAGWGLFAYDLYDNREEISEFIDAVSETNLLNSHKNDGSWSTEWQVH